MSLAAAACIHLQPTNCCPALDSSLHSTASSTASTTTIGSAVATTLSTAASLFSDDSVIFSLLLLPPQVDARQRGAARRRPRRFRRCSSAAAMLARLGRAARASPAPQATLRSSCARPRVSSASPGADENYQASSHFFLDSISVCDAGVHRWIELIASFPMVYRSLGVSCSPDEPETWVA